MLIPETKIEEVRTASDVVDVVSNYVQLKRSGTNYFGLCPFHSEKTPSFSVNPNMGIFKCFGCGAGGDVFKFVMDVEHVDFPEAVRMLAEEAGIELPEDDDDAGRAASSEAETLEHALRLSARFFYRRLTDSKEGEAALEYVLGRGISRSSIKQFGIGYAPDSWDALLKHAEAEQVNPAVLERAGLVIPRKERDGWYDRFRGRVIFPIFSHSGRVVGFGGRILDPDSDQAKYINSPETPVYHKSEVLYGLYQARRTIRERKEVYVVEGYTDVVALHQHGIRNVVATCGTSLTPDHVRILKRYCDAIIFLNDSDTAGDASNMRSIDLALRQGLTPYVIELPAGEDPAGFVENHGGAELAAYLINPKYKWTFVQYHLIRAQSDGALESVEGERQTFESVLERIAMLDSRFEQETYLHQMAEAIGMPLVHLHEEFRKISRKRGRQTRQPREEPPPPVERPPSEVAVDSVPAQQSDVLPEEMLLIRLMLEFGRPLVEYILGNMALDEFSEGLVQQIVTEIIAQYEVGEIDRRPFVDGTHGAAVQSLVTEALVDRHAPSENWQRHLNVNVPRMNDEPKEAAADAMMLLKLDRIDASLQRVKRRHDAKEAAGDDVRAELEEIMALRRLRTQVEHREFLTWSGVEP